MSGLFSDESLSQRLIEANAIIRIDNIRGRLNSQLLEAILTCPLGGTVSARVPHKGESRVDPHLFSFQLTSNGFQATTDLTNRSCIIRILKRNGHAFKTYGSSLINILGHVKAEQARFLSAAYSVVNEWSAHGMPMSSDTRGQGAFRPWWQIIDWITLNLACLPSPLEGHQAAQAGASNPTLGWLREIFLKLSSQSRLEEPLSASEIAEFCAIHEELKIPGLQASADEEEGLRQWAELWLPPLRQAIPFKERNSRSTARKKPASSSQSIKPGNSKNMPSIEPNLPIDIKLEKLMTAKLRTKTKLGCMGWILKTNPCGLRSVKNESGLYGLVGHFQPGQPHSKPISISSTRVPANSIEITNLKRIGVVQVGFSESQ